jgi:glycosyltransferase involved in cell wall biosynthesis
MRILIATDAWRPQVNGVVSTLERMTQAAAEFGAKFEFLTPQGMWTAPLPTYPDIRLALPSLRRIKRRIEDAAPDHIHIATEGPIGWLTRRYCLKNKRIFTTSYHTRFPEYVSARIGIPERLIYGGLRYFHAPSAAVMAPTPTIGADLTRRGFPRVKLWTRGVNHALYRPRTKRSLDLPRPIFLSVGRLAVEKNLEALLDLDLPGSVVIVGEGPARAYLKRRYPKAHFLGAKHGEALANVYASADVFVFPSRTDTFGIVLIEALASGLPVAAFPVPGPIDVVASGAGVLDEDLRAACLKALTIPREQAREHSLRFTWQESARQFLDNIEFSRSEGVPTFAGSLATVGDEPTRDEAETDAEASPFATASLTLAEKA